MASFIGELKRRNVVRVAIAYAVVSWVLIEISATVFPILQLPDWTVKFITVLILLGFPVALILSWAYELTPEGLKPSDEVIGTESITHITGRKLDFIIIGFLVLAVGGLVLENYILVDEPEVVTTEASVPPAPAVPASVPEASDDEKSIAVLAFVNMSNDPEQEYFSDGIAEEILNGLVKVPDLRVAARTSAFSFKGQNMDIREIGETLDVNHVLEGSVRKSGDRLRITAQLIKVDDGYHLWSETYDRESDDIFAIQDEIALAVVDALEVTLGLTGDTSLVEQGTSNAEAYNWYLRGNYYIGQQSPDAFDKAIESYEKAIEVDPEFAGGHGGLAYGLAYGSIFYPYLDVVDIVRPAYQRALALDGNQPQALMAKEVDLVVSGQDFVGAEQAIRKALASAANKTLVIDAYWWILLQAQRRFDEALAYLEIAMDSDPLSPLVHQGMGVNYLWKGEFETALPYLETAMELNPNDFFAAWALATSYVGLNEFDEAETAVQLMEAITGQGGAWSLGIRNNILIAQGDEGEARAALEEMIKLHEGGETDPALVAIIGINYAKLGEVEEAVEWFEKGLDAPGPLIITMPQIFLHDNPRVWNHPRYQEFLTRLNLDDASVAAAKAAINHP